MNKIIFHLSSLTLVFLAAFVIQSCAINPVTGKKQIMLVSEEQELAMGRESDPSIIANFGLYDDNTLQAFINEKGKEMGRISHRPDINYQFRILDSPVINAFAVPGGFVYFTRGILAHFNNEAEFAGVLGHEIGHITARHSAAQLSKQQLYGGLFVAGMIFSEDFRQFGEVAEQGLGMLFLKFGRDDESQSDELGVSYSTQIGYDAHEMANFFGVLARLQSKSGQQIPEFMSTHPNPENRFERVHQLSKAYQQQLGVTNLKINRDSYLRMIDGLIYGEDPRQGYVEYNTFFHPQLKFHFPVPPNWQVVNTPQMVQMASPDGKAMMLMTLSDQKDLRLAQQSAVEEYGLEVLESASTNVNGLPAIAMLSRIKQDPQQQAQQQEDLRILTYLIQYDGLIYLFHGLSLNADFNTYYRVFANTMGNFDRLTDPSKINVQPDRIKIQQVAQSMTLKDALRSYNIPEAEMEEIAVLNNMLLTDRINSGILIKTLVRGRTGVRR